MPTTDITIAICHSCAVWLVNADESHLDDVHPDQRETMGLNADHYGHVIPTGVEADGYADCAICHDTVVDPELFEATVAD